MKPLSVVIAGVSADLQSAAAEAARLAAPNAKISTVPTVEEALAKLVAPGFCVILQPTPADAARIQQAGLPQLFPVLENQPEPDRDTGRFAILLEDQCEPRLWAQIFRAAVRHHQVLCENARLRGDLRTIAYRVNHDLRTPLGGIVTMGEVLKHELAETAADCLPMLESVFTSTDELGELIGRISFLLKASTRTLAKNPVKMGDVVLVALERLERRLRDAGVVIVQPSTWPELSAAASWLEIVWWELLRNALQHGAATRIELGWQFEGEGYRFWLADNGHDVPDARRSTLFSPFHSLHEPDSGSGLGLSIIQRLVELQGGTCNYERINGLTRFSFTLPATP